MIIIDIPNVEAKGPIKISTINRSQQSANVFLHCMKKFEYLKYILENKAFMPRYNEEIIDYLSVEYKRIAFPMVCFCDIYLNKLKPHMGEYGEYGIGLSKEWGINNGLQPIFYINQHSELAKSFRETLFNGITKFEQDSSNNSVDFDIYINNIFTFLLFIKPISGLMKVDGTEKHLNFHDEKEWRYIPNMSDGTELPLVLYDHQITDRSRNLYSDGIKTRKKLWLKIEYEDIKYLLVGKSSDRDLLINFIVNDINIDVNDKYVLISKIIVYNEMEDDL